ncbi:MAG TPA: hypothetical protein PK710_02010 [Polyangiaceae bacterium]|nr:hypothetical protein [Polyangiaceae bacterium]HPY20177.1 hypothetical protein [Polyangiaceae bacterium]HQB43771.1 hypothetical protein [Polyangiaceae bacterium]HQF24087.1 hypothetical protein [Polyangiaceae bacterium]HQM10776.1 hypothetical protein [Polyangiaceae bacterium]
MISRRHWMKLAGLSLLAAGCEAIGLKATVVTSRTVNGQTTTTVREARNWEEFEQAMGEVATDFSDFAKEVGSTTAELAKKLVDVPPQGQVQLGQLSPSLAPYQGDVRYDYLKVARMNPNAKYDFKYVQIGMPEYDNFFRASAEMYAAAYQLTETGRHVYLASYNAQGQEAPSDVQSGRKPIRKDEIEALTSQLGESESAKRLTTLWEAMAELGGQLAAKAGETAQTGMALVASAPSQILNPKLVLHIDLIVKGLEQSVSLVKDTGSLLGKMVG